MCTKKYLRRLSELSEGLMTLYMKKLAILVKLKDKTHVVDGTEGCDAASSEEFVCPKEVRILLDDLFRKMLTIADERKWDEYAGLLNVFMTAISDIPGLKPAKMDADTKKMFDSVLLMLDEAKEEIALDDKNLLISCKNSLYKVD